MDDPDPLALPEPVVNDGDIRWFPGPGEQWRVVAESSGRTRPSLGTGSRSSGGHGRRFVGITPHPGFSSPSVH